MPESATVWRPTPVLGHLAYSFDGFTCMTEAWASLLQEFKPRHLPATVATGLTMAFINSLLSVALMTLIFSESLSEALPVGIGVGLVASAAMALIIAVTSGFAGMYGGIQDTSAAVLALATASIASTLVGPEAVDTVLAMMMATSLATGAVFLAMGTFRLGELGRFVPFPVIGGLLAGTGYLILVGALDILRPEGTELMTIDALGLLWPGLAFAGAFLLASLRGWPSRAYLGLLVGGLVAFHAISQLAGVAKDASLDRGWLLGPFPEGGLWPGVAAEALTSADWGAIAGEAASLITILLLVPLTLLVYISALEVGTNTDLDLNAELRTSGWANVASGAVGGPPGFFYLSDTLITHRLLGGRRGPPVIAAFGMLAIVLMGGSVLEFLPQFVIGGLLLFVGVDFMLDWLWSSRRRMTRLDYTLMVGIVVIIAVIGFLPGVAAGLAAAIALFVYRYSRIDVVKHSLTVREHRSNIERPRIEADVLDEVGESVLILELQGFIFFGTANQVIDRTRERLRDEPLLRHVLFDFRQVSGADSSAVALFGRLALIARESGFTIVLTGLKASAEAQFAEFLSSYSDVVVVEPDLDHGMQWCEDRLLEGIVGGEGAERALPEGLVERLGSHLVSRDIPAGEALMRLGDPTPGMFLIAAGRATVLLDELGHELVRLRTLREGTIVGEIGLYLKQPCTATVVADTACRVLHLTPQAFDELCRDDPGTAAELHAFVARSLASRLSHADGAIRALRD